MKVGEIWTHIGKGIRRKDMDIRIESLKYPCKENCQSDSHPNVGYKWLHPLKHPDVNLPEDSIINPTFHSCSLKFVQIFAKVHE